MMEEKPVLCIPCLPMLPSASTASPEPASCFSMFLMSPSRAVSNAMMRPMMPAVRSVTFMSTGAGTVSTVAPSKLFSRRGMYCPACVSMVATACCMGMPPRDMIR